MFVVFYNLNDIIVRCNQVIKKQLTKSNRSKSPLPNKPRNLNKISKKRKRTLKKSISSQ